MKKVIENLALRVLALSVVAAVGACSDSVLFEENSHPPLPPPAPINQVGLAPGQRPATNLPTTNPGDPASAFMSMTLKDTTCFDSMFGSEANLVTDDHTKLLHVAVTFKMYQSDISQVSDTSENRAILMFLVSQYKTNGDYFRREFVASSPVVIKRDNGKDILSGKLHDFAHPEKEFDLHAERSASTSLEDSRRNAWTGQIKQGDKVLADFTGTETIDVNAK